MRRGSDDRTGDMFGGGKGKGPRKPKPPPDPNKPKRHRVEMDEWYDEITEKTHTCPLRYLAIRHMIPRGKEHAIHAATLVRMLGERPTTRKEADRLERHVRKTMFILQRKYGEMIVSLHSEKGGYYRPTEEADVEQHCRLQDALARSMLAGSRILRAAWKKLNGKGD